MTWMPTPPHDLVELVIPTFRRPDVIAQAVDSALSETPFRVTVLDDHSPQPVESVVDVERLNSVYDGRLRVIRNPFNLGASLNILHALQVSRAPYTWAFSDDLVLTPGAGARVVEAIMNYPRAVVLFWHSGISDTRHIDLDGLQGFVELIESSRSAFGFSDLHYNRVVRTDVGCKYLRLDARFSHAQPMLGIQLAALADRLPVHIRGGTLAIAQPRAASGWSVAYLERFKLEPSYLIPDPALRSRYRAVVARDFPWRAALVDLPDGMRGSIDEAFALDAAALAAHSALPLRLRAEVWLALCLRGSRLGRLLARFTPKARGTQHEVEFSDMAW
jgi:glycosyltransferase involved in cell wall biosynthesis